ncbi:MAG: polyamine aminopropyltransferase [Myxococcales bacterium]|nr:polyamine aminopropyltransferase [Myxococcales bacterium]
MTPAEWLLYLTVVVISTCGLVYELVAGAVSTYLLGDSVTQLSTVVGVHLSAMGLGAWLSSYVTERPAQTFVHCQLGAALVGGASAPVLYLTFAETSHVRFVMYALVTVTGVLVGAQIPLLVRVLRRRVAFRDVVPRVLALDYVGALVGSVAFALLVLPSLGVMRAGIAFGVFGAVAALWGTWALGTSVEPRPLRVRAGVVLAVMAGLLFASSRVAQVADESLMLQPVMMTRQTPYQRIVMTQHKSGFNLFLDGNLQFASSDEYRYHEALVHPAFAVAARRARVLVLGGGDGLAVREILRHPEVSEVTLVDLDPGMTSLSRDTPVMRDLNRGSLSDPRVTVVNDDAMVWVAATSGGVQSDAPASAAAAPEGRPPGSQTDGTYDVVIVDFPDPNNFALGKLYTVRFYKLLRRRLAEGAAVVVQSTSPLVARQSFWCVVRSMEEAGFFVRPYHAFVPSFGEWGFALARLGSFEVPREAPGELRWLTSAILPSLFEMPPDMARVDVEPNRLNNQALVRYYEAEWQRWAR